MAQNQSFIARVVAPKNKLIPDRYPVPRRTVFSHVLFNRFGMLVKINTLMALFMAPAAVWLWLNAFNKQGVSALFNFTGNFGFGYPLVTDAASSALIYNFNLDMLTNYILMPLLLLAAVGFAGGFYTIRLASLGHNFFVVEQFFKGVKKAILPCLLGTALVGAAYLFLARNILIMGIAQVNVAHILLLILSIILLILAASVALFLITHSCAFKAGAWTLIKNSFIFGMTMLPTSIIFIALAALPIVLLWWWGAGFAWLFLLFYGIMGLGMSALLWTLYGNYVYAKYYVDEAKGMPVYKKKDKEQKRNKKPAANVKFVNPKKIKRNKNAGDNSSSDGINNDSNQ